MSNTAKKLNDDSHSLSNNDFANNFSTGELVEHEFYGYRGVIIKIDQKFEGNPEQREKLNLNEQNENSPWYHVLIDGTENVAYVEESSLKADSNTEPIDHPMVFEFFDRFEDGKYLRVLH